MLHIYSTKRKHRSLWLLLTWVLLAQYSCDALASISALDTFGSKSVSHEGHVNVVSHEGHEGSNSHKAMPCCDGIELASSCCGSFVPALFTHNKLYEKHDNSDTDLKNSDHVTVLNHSFTPRRLSSSINVAIALTLDKHDHWRADSYPRQHLTHCTLLD